MVNIRRLIKGKLEGLCFIRQYLNNHRNLSNAGIALALVVVICASLIIATPVNAVQLSITNLSSTMYRGNSYSFFAQVDIQSQEALPIQSLRLDINGPASAWVNFRVDGTIISQSGQFTGISPVSLPYQSSSPVYGYASGYGYSSSTGFGNITENWGYGTGYYGYGYNVLASTSTTAKYQVTLDTSGFSDGAYTAQLTANVTPSPDRFISGSYDFTLTESSSGNNGAPEQPPVVEPAGTSDIKDIVSDSGVFTKPIVIENKESNGAITSADFNIAKDTVGLDKDGNPLTQITMATDTTPPAPPANNNVIGLPYSFGPDGATFNPPAEISFNYDPAKLPAGVNENNLVAAFYDKKTGSWVQLTCIVDTDTHTVIAQVPHFTTFALLANAITAQPPVIVNPKPASFALGTLALSASEVKPNDKVEVSTTVSNSGEVSGNYTVTFKINGVVEDTRAITVAAGATEKVTFTTSKSVAGTYTVDVNGLTGAFTVKAAAQPTQAAPSGGGGEGLSTTTIISLVLIGICIIAAVAAYIVWRRRKNMV